MGNLLAALDANGLGERTLVICTTAHGLLFPGAKRPSTTAASASC